MNAGLLIQEAGSARRRSGWGKYSLIQNRLKVGLAIPMDTHWKFRAYFLFHWNRKVDKVGTDIDINRYFVSSISF